ATFPGISGRILSSARGPTGRFPQPLPRLRAVAPDEIGSRHALAALRLNLLESQESRTHRHDETLLPRLEYLARNTLILRDIKRQPHAGLLGPQDLQALSLKRRCRGRLGGHRADQADDLIGRA